MTANLENSAVTIGKRSVFIPIPKKGNAKEWSSYCTITLISHPSKEMLKTLQATLQQYVNWELTDVQSVFRKSRGTRNQISNIRWIIEKASKFQKNIYFWFIDYAKAFGCVEHNKLGEILKELWITGQVTCLLRNLYAGQEATVRNGDEQQTVSKLGRECIKAVYCHLAYLTSMQSTLCEMPGWMKHKLESRFLGEISITSDMQMRSPL